MAYLGMGVVGPVTRWWREVVLSRTRVVRHIPVAGRRLAVSLLLVNILLGLLPVGFLLATSHIVGLVPQAVAAGVDSSAYRTLRTNLLAAGVIFALQTIVAPVQTLLGELMTRRVDGWLQRELISTSLRSTGIAPMEDSLALDALDEVSRMFEGRLYTPGSACAGMLALVARYIRLLTLLVLLAFVISWVPSAVLGIAVGIFRVGQRGGLRIFARIYDSGVNAEFRRASYLQNAAMGKGHAKEVRIYDLSAWFSERYGETYLAANRKVNAARRRVFLWPYVGYTVFGLGATIYVCMIVATQAATEQISLTEMALALQIVLGLTLMGAHYAESDLQTALGMRTWTALDLFEARITELENLSKEIPRTTTWGPSDTRASVGGPCTINFRSVSFTYPASESPTLDRLDLELSSGRSTALVGLNGAGKTTIVKLLTRLYEPDAGHIDVNDVDVRDVPIETWRRQVSVVFQDFGQYEMSAADNISCGASHIQQDISAVRKAAKQAGILDFLESLPMGLNTTLSRAYKGGVDLSGGQWQRVAIARSLYALSAGARVLVLDEPTSALDIRAEAEFFDAFVEITHGVTSLLISHRFSTVRRADHIVVLDGGQAAEQGSHRELMSSSALYRRLYNRQAESFVAGFDEDFGAKKPGAHGRI